MIKATLTYRVWPNCKLEYLESIFSMFYLFFITELSRLGIFLNFVKLATSWGNPVV